MLYKHIVSNIYEYYQRDITFICLFFSNDYFHGFKKKRAHPRLGKESKQNDPAIS